jgi:Ca2+-binding RTX toxin-like protein
MPPYTVQLSGPQDETGSFATTDDGEVARSWYASVYNQSPGQSFKAFALCTDSLAATGADDGGGGATAFKCGGRTATIVGTSGNDHLKGTAKPDVIVGLGGNDRLSGRDGDDRICGGPGDDRIRGGKGRDRLYGDDGRDRLAGCSGPDLLKGGNGPDRLRGGPGRDKLVGGPGLDIRKQ